MNKIVFTLLLLFNISLIHAQTDSLVFKKVRDVVGEVKHLKLGSITIETDYSENDFVVEWDKVIEFYSNRTYIITLSEGERHIGKINTDPGNKVIANITTSDKKEIKTTLTQIVDFKPLDPGFWDQLSASIDLGYSFTKANNVSQITLRSQIGYLTENWITNISFDATRNAQDSIETTQRTDVIGSYSYFLGYKWFVFGAVSFLQNDEQKLELRSTPKAGIGKYIIITNHLYLSLILGGAWNSESYTDPSIEDRSSAEAFMGTEFNIFEFENLSLLTNIYAYKDMAQSDRFRTDFKIDLKYDLPLEFYIKLGYTLNYDSDPVEGASESDFVLQTTFGWELW